MSNTVPVVGVYDRPTDPVVVRLTPGDSWRPGARPPFWGKGGWLPVTTWHRERSICVGYFPPAVAEALIGLKMFRDPIRLSLWGGVQTPPETPRLVVYVSAIPNRLEDLSELVATQGAVPEGLPLEKIRDGVIGIRLGTAALWIPQQWILNALQDPDWGPSAGELRCHCDEAFDHLIHGTKPSRAEAPPDSVPGIQGEVNR